MSEASMADFHQRIVDEFRAHDGVVPSLGGSSPLLVLHHIGARSGKGNAGSLPRGGRRMLRHLRPQRRRADAPRLAPQPQGQPTARVELGHDTVPVLATKIMGEERDRF
jgi:hypothetical protein